MSSVLSSIKWSFSTSIIRKIITFVLFLVIANIFDRNQLGIYREFALIIGFFGGISLFSSHTLYIVEKDNTLFQKLLPLILILTLLISCILTLSAPLLGSYYHSVTLTFLLRFSLPVLLLEVLRQYIRSFYQKQMNFRFLSIVETMNVLFYSVIALILIPLIPDIKLFILIFYTGNLLEMILLFHRCQPLNIFPKSFTSGFLSNPLIRSVKAAKEKLHFLFFSTSATTINMLLLELPVLILGLYFKPEHIGNYFIAFQLIMMPSSLITMSLSQVFFSKFSQIDTYEYKDKLNRLYDIEFNLLIPAFLIYALLIREWIPVFFGTKNILEIRWIVLFLFFKSMSLFIMNPISSFFAILKKPQIEFYWSVIALFLSNLVVYLFRHQSFVMVLGLFISLSVLIYLSFNWLVFHQIKYSISRFNRHLLFMFLQVAIIIGIWFMSNRFITTMIESPYILLSTKTILALLILSGYLFVKNRFTNNSIITQVNQLIRTQRV